MRLRSSRTPSPRSALRAWVLGAASAAVACALAGRAQLTAKPEAVHAAVAPQKRVEAAGPIIRLQPPCTGIACVRLKPARDYEAAFGGAAKDADPAGPSMIRSDDPDLMFTRDAVQDWAGQRGGDANQP